MATLLQKAGFRAAALVLAVLLGASANILLVPVVITSLATSGLGMRQRLDLAREKTLRLVRSGALQETAAILAKDAMVEAISWGRSSPAPLQFEVSRREVTVPHPGG